MKQRKDKKGRNLYPGELQRPDGRYCFRYTDAAGRRRCIYAKDLPELREREALLTKDLVDGIEADKHLTLNDLFEMYIDVKQLKASTASNYSRLWELHVRDGIGMAKVVNIHTSDVKLFCADMTKRNYSRSTIRLLLLIIRSSLEMAVEDNVIRFNPAKGISIKGYGNDPAERDALSVTQQERLLEFIRNSSTYAKHYPMIVIMLGTGMRAGEAIGLTWNCVDFKNREILVDKQLTYKDHGDGYRFHLTTPKTKAGCRTIPMTREVYDAFQKQREINFARGVPRDVEIEGLKGFVFPSADGGPMMPASLNSILYNIVKAYNKQDPPEPMPKFSAHVLRHTACTRFAEAGVPIKATSYIMGHADSNITISVYEHITDLERIRDDLEKIKFDPSKGDVDGGDEFGKKQAK